MAKWKNELMSGVVELLKSNGFVNCRVQEVPDMVDDYGNEYLFLIHACTVDEMGYKELPIMADKACKIINEVLFTCEGDHIETMEKPIILNSTVVFPITLLK